MPDAFRDPVLDTLLLPLAGGDIALPGAGQVLFLRARPGEALNRLPRDLFVCRQGFKPQHDALTRAGYSMAENGGTYPLVLVLPQRQREENRALLAEAVNATQAGGIVLAAASNLEGAKTLEGDLAALMGQVTSVSKNKCRAFWARVEPGRVDAALQAEWLGADAPRPVADGRFMSRPGLFAWDRIDAGSRLLAENLPAGLSGRVADLGAGFGYLSDEVLSRYPAVTQLDVIEAEQRALDMARLNLARYGERVAFHWLDATGPLPGRYDAIVSNPPFHIDRADRHDIGQAFIRSAAAALAAGGQLWLVANRHLPYEDTLTAAFKSVATIAQNNFFKVFKAVGPKNATKGAGR